MNSSKDELVIFERSVFSDKYIFAYNNYKNKLFTEGEWVLILIYNDYLVNL